MSVPTQKKPYKIASNADTGNKVSIDWANKVAETLSRQTGIPLVSRSKKKGQTLGNEFEQACADFIKASFSQLSHLRPGLWEVSRVTSRSSLIIGEFDQYSHLAELGVLAEKNQGTASFFGRGVYNFT